jgi:electron transfer flavoprotein beta subunit
MTPEVVALVSPGRHPASGRPRRAPYDARAVELGLRLAGPALGLVHAGDAANPALRDYLGMGAAGLTALALPAAADAVPALIDHLGEVNPDLVLAGLCGEGGEDSGLVPYLVAEGLRAALVPNVVAATPEDGGARFLQALPGGQRRAVAAPYPIVATLDLAAPPPRPSAFARARRGRVVRREATVVPDTAPGAWKIAPARPRPRRLGPAVTGSAAERLRAITESRAGAGTVIEDLAPEDAARLIHEYLIEAGVAAPSP